MKGTEPQETHAIYLDHDQVGNPRVSITLARRGRRGGGKRIRSLTGRGQGCGLPAPVHHPVEPSRETAGNRSPGPPPRRIPLHQRGGGNPDAAPHGCGEGGAEDRAGPEAGRRHRRHAQLRGQLVVGLSSEPEPATEGHPGSGTDVRVTDFSGHFSLTPFGGTTIHIRATPTSFGGRNSDNRTGTGDRYDFKQHRPPTHRRLVAHQRNKRRSCTGGRCSSRAPAREPAPRLVVQKTAHCLTGYCRRIHATRERRPS